MRLGQGVKKQGEGERQRLRLDPQCGGWRAVSCREIGLIQRCHSYTNSGQGCCWTFWRYLVPIFAPFEICQSSIICRLFYLMHALRPRTAISTVSLDMIMCKCSNLSISQKTLFNPHPCIYKFIRHQLFQHPALVAFHVWPLYDRWLSWYATPPLHNPSTDRS